MTLLIWHGMHICSLNIVDCTVMRLFSFFSVQVREGDATGSTKWDGVAFAVKNWSVNLANSTPKKEKEDEAKMLTKMVDLMRCTEAINPVPTYPIPQFNLRLFGIIRFPCYAHRCHQHLHFLLIRQINLFRNTLLIGGWQLCEEDPFFNHLSIYTCRTERFRRADTHDATLERRCCRLDDRRH